MKTVIATISVVIGFVTALLVYRSMKPMEQKIEKEEFNEQSSQNGELNSNVREEEKNNKKNKNWPDDYVDLSGGMLGIY